MTTASDAENNLRVRPSFELLEHTADIGIAAHGEDLAELFCAAAEGLRHILSSSPGNHDQERQIVLSGQDIDELLVSWLQEILYLFESELFFPTAFTILEVSEHHLEATLFGTRFDPSKHLQEREVKAVTYHRLSVGCHDGTWHATVYLDL